MKHAHFCIRCTHCGATTTKVYASKHDGHCKACSTPAEEDPLANAPGYREYTRSGERIASREVQHARYIDCGPAAWDDR